MRFTINTIKRTRWVACAIMALFLQYMPAAQAAVAVKAPGIQNLIQVVQRNQGWVACGLIASAGVYSLARRSAVTTVAPSVASSGAVALSPQAATLTTDASASMPATRSVSVPAPSLSSAFVPTFDYGAHSPADIQKIIDDPRLVAYFGPLQESINTRITDLGRQLTSEECSELSKEILARAYESSSTQDAIMSAAGIPLPIVINKLVSHQNNERFTQETLTRADMLPTDMQDYITGILTGAPEQSEQEPENEQTAAVQEGQTTTLDARAGIDTVFKRIPDIVLTTLAHPAPVSFTEDLLPNAYRHLNPLAHNELGVVFNDKNTLIQFPSEWAIKQTIINTTGTIVCCILQNKDCYLINTVTKQYFKISNIDSGLCLTTYQQTGDTLILKEVAHRSLLGDRLRRIINPETIIGAAIVSAADNLSSPAKNNNRKISFKALERHSCLALSQAIGLSAADSACRMQLDRASRKNPIVRPLASQPWTITKLDALKKQKQQIRILKIKGAVVLVGVASIAALACYEEIKHYVEKAKTALLIARLLMKPVVYLSRLAMQSAGSLTTSAGVRVQSAVPMAEFAGSL